MFTIYLFRWRKIIIGGMTLLFCYLNLHFRSFPLTLIAPLCHCLFVDRASIEPNFHDLYLKFLDKANSKSLFKEIVQATYENCKVLQLQLGTWSLRLTWKWYSFASYLVSVSFQVLLGSELIKSSSEERSLLKNLGSWLGKITIGKNHVLRAREIDPKSLIIEVFAG